MINPLSIEENLQKIKENKTRIRRFSRVDLP